ncbi:MAG: hypothetical protein AAGA30_19670, partial [Planctomycetota bacterium]
MESMFFDRNHFIVALFVIATTATSTLWGQQSSTSPSQRFNPVRNIPPSVHVPAAQAKQLPGRTSPASKGTSFNFSDTPSGEFRDARIPSPNANNSRSTRQISFNEELKPGSPLPQIPSILRSPKSTKQPFQPPKATNPLPVNQFPGLQKKSAAQAPPRHLVPPAKGGASQKEIVVDQNRFAETDPSFNQKFKNQIQALRDKTDAGIEAMQHQKPAAQPAFPQPVVGQVPNVKSTIPSAPVSSIGSMNATRGNDVRSAEFN